MDRTNKRLIIYYDNPNEASNMYLKMLRRDADERGVEIVMTDDINWLELNLGLHYDVDNDFVLPLFPLKDLDTEERMMALLCKYPYADIDNISGHSMYCWDATAMGIYEYIIKNCPNRESTIGVIGRGKVGKALVNLLIDYGYTVFNYNSKTSPMDLIYTARITNVLVGLSSQDYIITEEHLEDLPCRIQLIDAGNNFCTKDKLRCGKWTRNVLFERIMA